MDSDSGDAMCQGPSFVVNEYECESLSRDNL